MFDLICHECNNFILKFTTYDESSKKSRKVSRNIRSRNTVGLFRDCFVSTASTSSDKYSPPLSCNVCNNAL